MPLVIVIGSHVAGSRVGGTVANLCLAMSPWKIDPVHVPTTLLGRHPGWGAPGGAGVEASTMAGMLQGIEANGLFSLADGVITNYFTDRAQIEVASAAIDQIKMLNPRAHILVDPVMGDVDAGGAYVSDAVQTGIVDLLLPRATIITPNIWEIGRLARAEATDARMIAFEQAANVAGSMQTAAPEIVITSLPAVPGLMGLGLLTAAGASSIRHKQLAKAPRGTGDLLSAAYLACRLGELNPADALKRASDFVYRVLVNAESWGAEELPLVASQHCWQEPSSDLNRGNQQ